MKPSRRLKAELRDYQQTGLNWLTFLWKNGLGGVLADDMGLGKTVQTLALVARAVDADRETRFLVVAPTSVVPNWVAECRKFVPGLRVSAITETPARSGQAIGDQVAGAHIVVTSYTLLRLLFDDLEKFAWDGAFFDEAQFIKNHTGKTHQCARRARGAVQACHHRDADGEQPDGAVVAGVGGRARALPVSDGVYRLLP